MGGNFHGVILRHRDIGGNVLVPVIPSETIALCFPLCQSGDWSNRKGSSPPN
jgi:hypothetical protein